MNLTKKIIEEFEEKFDAIIPLKVGTTWDKREKNCSHDLTEYKTKAKNDLKSFLLSSLHQIATEAIEAVRLEEQKHYGCSYSDDYYDAGYNSARGEMEQKAKKFLENL